MRQTQPSRLNADWRHGAERASDAVETVPDPFVRGRAIGRLGAWTIAVLFGSAALWLWFAPLNSAVVAPGQVKVTDYRKTVQHLEGGIVQAVLVKDGDRVQAGQVLLQLEEVQADAAVQGLQDQLDAELVRRARADAERLLRPAFVVPAELRVRKTGRGQLPGLLAAETELFRVRRQQLTGQTELLRSQAAQVRAEMGGLQAQIDSGHVNRRLIADELAINRDLVKREFVQATRLLTFERALAERDERKGGYDAEHARAQQKLVELELKAIGMQDDYVKRAVDEFSDAQRRVLDLQERLRPLSNTLARQMVVAPVAGEIVDLRVHTVGGVVAPREALMDIVPDHHTLLVEARVRPEDVAELAVGQPVDVQILAFKQRSTPLLTGTLRYISADSLSEATNGVPAPYYLVQVAIDASSEAALPSRLTAGMPATLFIQTRARSALDFLLQPLTDSVRHAMRER
jgi:HlyD family type I secretion membrane fusion protein